MLASSNKMDCRRFLEDEYQHPNLIIPKSELPHKSDFSVRRSSRRCRPAESSAHKGGGNGFIPGKTDRNNSKKAVRIPRGRDGVDSDLRGVQRQNGKHCGAYSDVSRLSHAKERGWHY